MPEGRELLASLVEMDRESFFGCKYEVRRRFMI